MVKKRKPKQIATSAVFDPNTDKPLRHFSVTNVFVRSTRVNNYKLFVEGYMVMMFTYDGFLYKFHHCDNCDKEYIEAFLSTYAPHFDYKNKKCTLKTLHPNYIGLPELTLV